MRHLRHTLKSLSPVIVLIPVLCGIISAQSGLTTIQDTLFDADGARYNGTLTIEWSTFDTTNPGTIIQQSKTVQVVNGNLLVQLAPNNTATPPANVYNVLYESDGDQQYSETWTVPVSANALTVAQVRTGGGVGSTGGGSVGGLTGGTGTPESSITNLVSDLNARPIKGPGFGTNAVAVVDQNGQIETAVGNLGDCVFVDGTTGPCSAGITLPTFVNGETPGGVVNGLNPTFTLANTPSGTSLLLFRNGVLTQAGVDYTLTGSTITFANPAIPQPLDTLLASYRIDPGSTVAGSGVSTGPSGSPGVNGCGAVNAVSKNAAYQIVPADNGTLFIQTASAGFSLPVTPPAAGWCTALLNTSGSNLSVNNSGNKINGATAAYQLQAGNSVLVFSDGSGYWATGGNGAQGPAGPAGSSGVAPAGTGTVQVTNGTAGLVSGSATNCVLVNGTSSPCGGAPGGSNGQIQYNNAGVFSGFAPAVNGTAISTPSTLNFLNSAAFNGITLGFSNPTGGSVQLGASGTLNNSGLTNSSMTVNGQTCTLGSSCSVGGVGTVTSFYSSPFAKCQNNAPALTSSISSGSGPTGQCNTTGVPVYGTAVFSGTAQSVQDTFVLPPNWTAVTALAIEWRSSSTTGSVTWSVQTGCVAAGSTIDSLTFNSASSVSHAPQGTALQIRTDTISNPTTTGCSAGSDMFFKIGVTANSTGASVEGIKYTFTTTRSN